MSRPLRGDLSQLVLPRDLEHLRTLAQQAGDEGATLGALYAALLEEAPMALVDLSLGPRALRSDAAIDAALEVIDALESSAGVSGVYRRLVGLSSSAGPRILAVALRRHPEAGWLVGLSEAVEEAPGAGQLAACRGREIYEALCWAHARAGHGDGLVNEAAASGRPEPSAALAAHGLDEHAVAAARAALTADPRAPVEAWLMAARGPSARALLVAIAAPAPPPRR